MFVCICTHEYMCVYRVSTNMVTFSFQYIAVIESNDTTILRGISKYSHVLTCARTCT